MLNRNPIVLFAQLDDFLLMVLQLGTDEITFTLGALRKVRSLDCRLRGFDGVRSLVFE